MLVLHRESCVIRIDDDVWARVLMVVYVFMLVLIPLGIWKLGEIIYWVFMYLSLHLSWR